jgi:serine/threonine protein kinase
VVGAPSEALSPLPVDLYAFACMAFEALTAELLFDGEDEATILAEHAAHDGWPRRNAELVRVPGCREIATLLAACLRKDQRLRPTAKQARRALAELAPQLARVAWPLAHPVSELSA